MRVCKNCVNHEGESCKKFGGKYPADSSLAENCKEYLETPDLCPADEVINDIIGEASLLEAPKDIKKKVVKKKVKKKSKKKGKNK